MMALQNLHEMIRNLSSYIKSLEVLCESGLRLAKNFERLLSPGQLTPFMGDVGGVAGKSGGSQQTTSHTIDSDVLSQSVATWELAHKVATADSNTLISELLPLLQETVQSVMKDTSAFHSANTYEVFRSCFSAFGQIQWRFCSLYLQCTSSYPFQGYYSRSPPERSPTLGSFSSSSGGDRRESTESCFSSFSLPRSSFSLSSRSTSPSFQLHHLHTRSRNSSPSVKFTPSQPPSPYGESGYSFFRRWSTHTSHAYNPQGSGSSSSNSSGPNPNTSSSSNLPSYPSSSSNAGFTTLGFSRRWSVPAHGHSSSTDSRISEDDDYNGLLDAINLLSVKPPSPSLKLTPTDELGGDFSIEQSRSLWPPSDSMPGVVLTPCTTSEADSSILDFESYRPSSTQTLRVPPYGIPEGIQPLQSLQLQPISGEYTLFGNLPSTTAQSHGQLQPESHHQRN